MSFSKISAVVPDIKKTFSGFSQPAVIKANANLLSTIQTQNISSISKWGKVFNLSDGIIISFIATESGGKFTGVNRFQACGLMQVTPNAVWDCVRKWRDEVSIPMPQQAESVLRVKLPFLYTSKAARPSGGFVCGTVYSDTKGCVNYKVGTTGEVRAIIDALTTDNDFNILCGCLVLRWLLERFTSRIGNLNLGQLNKAIVGYNAGAYLGSLGGTSRARAKVPIDTLSLYNKVSSEPKGYILKMLGVNGFMDIIYKKGLVKVAS
jgi:hypothetical protein